MIYQEIIMWNKLIAFNGPSNPLDDKDISSLEAQTDFVQHITTPVFNRLMN